MGWATEVKVFLIVLVFSKWPLTAGTLLQEFSLTGTPLSEAEYKDFFRTLTDRQVLHAVCIRRSIFGCYDPTIQALDLYENHGIIPNGWICTDFPDNASFPGFCDFALYRCISKKYFAKRVLCPDETTQKSTVTQTDLEGTLDDLVMSTTEGSSEIAESTESSPELLTTVETPAIEISTMALPTTTTNASLPKLLSSSSIEMAAKLISQILDALTAATNTSSESAISESLMELTSASTATAAPESSFELAMTTTMADEFLIELTSTAAIITEPELDLATVATVAAPTQATTPEPTESVPDLATAVELISEPASDTTESFLDLLAHTTTTTSNPETCIVDYPEPLSTSTDSTSSPAATATTPASTLPIHTAATTAVAADTSPMTTASPQIFVPIFDAPIPFPPPQPNSTMRILILSYIGDKKGNNEDAAGTSPSLQTASESDNILQQEEIENPLPINSLKDLFFRLHDKSVQRLMHKMQDRISGE